MKFKTVCGAKVSEMSLGTVQLGMNYGIANNAGQPKEEQSFEMLRTALANGVCSLDTARAYGNSEDVLGRFLTTVDEKPFITTKVPEFNADGDKEIEKFIIENVETSLSKLGVSKVNNIMLHNSYNLFHNADKTAEVMGSLISRGYCDMVGASVYTAEDVHEVLKHPEYTATQIPMSIFDQRLIVGGVVEELRQRDFTVFVRSVFLQGVFFLDPEKITDPILLEYAKPKILKLREYAETEGMSIAEIAISFMRDVPGITSLVLGADTPGQVLSNAKYFDAPSISEKTTASIKDTFKDVNIPKIMEVLARPKK